MERATTAPVLPEPNESDEDRQARYDEQRARVELEVGLARRSAARLARVLGVMSVGVGLVLSYATYLGMAEYDVYVAELSFVSAWILVAGTCFLVFGAGGTAGFLELPFGVWMGFLFVTALLALMTFIPLGRLLAYFAGYDLSA